MKSCLLYSAVYRAVQCCTVAVHKSLGDIVAALQRRTGLFTMKTNILISSITSSGFVAVFSPNVECRVPPLPRYLFMY